MQDKRSSEIDYDTLRFIRIFTPLHVPKELVEQVRDRCFEVDDWYKYQEQICTNPSPTGPVLNPYSLLYVVANEGNKVVGMLWCEIQALSKTLIIQTFSMDKEYWGRGRAVNLLSNKAKEIVKECKLKKVVWRTSYPKHSERYGFRRAKSVMMEWKPEEEQEKEDGRHNDGIRISVGDSGVNDGGTERCVSPNASGSGTGSEPGDNGIAPGRRDESRRDERHVPDIICRSSHDEL